MSRSAAISLAMLILFPGIALAEYAEDSYIGWKILHRNRILSTIKEEERFLYTLVNYRDRAQRDSGRCDPRFFNVYKPTGRDPRPRSRTDLRKNCRKAKYPAPTNGQFITRWNPATHIHDRDYVGANWKDRSARVRLGLFKPDRPGPIGWREDLGYTCNWTIDGKLVAENENCRRLETYLQPGNRQITIQVLRDGKPFFRYPEEGSESIVIRDHVIAVLGDSFGSGEGNPHVFRVRNGSRHKVPGPAKWLDPRCHRSLLASSGILSALLADKFKHDRFSLVSFACSGAESGEGILEPYYGRETANQVHCDWVDTNGLFIRGRRFDQYLGSTDLFDVKRCVRNQASDPADRDIPAQIEQLKNALCDEAGNCDRPELILIYIGVNDIRFSKIVTKLITKCNPAECERALGGEFDAGLKSLRANLKKIDDQLSELGISPANKENIVLVTYPDPLTDKKQNGKFPFCDWSKAKLRPADDRAPNFLGGLGALIGLGTSEASAKWAHDRILVGLNDELERAGNRFGWSVVDTETIALGHGYCSPRRWFQIWPESEDKQGIIIKDYVPDSRGNGWLSGGVPSGAMHPNIYGHWNVQAELMKVVPGLLELE